jgi:TonB-dependent Receptor Plug Domain/CarboxypepD_reg-like domain
MNRKTNFLSLVALLLATSVYAQKTFTISGHIKDAESGEELISANLIDAVSAKGTVSNTYGFFSLTLPKGKVALKFTYVGYVEEIKSFELDKDLELNVLLKPSVALQEVEILATKAERIEERSQMSRIDVPIQQIKKIPALLGEVDVLKALQLLPGVQGGTEGQSGIYVRGGGPDQNLITLDGVPVYNVSHLGGFFSVFNADALKNVTLYKGGFPARYGGRLSSVIDINMKEGNNQSFHGEGSIGLITSRLTLEGPIWKDKTSFIISGRRTYLDLLIRPIIAAANSSDNEGLAPEDQSKFDLKLHFYDLNAKINHKINDKHRVYLSAYSGLDIFGPTVTDGVKDKAGYQKINFGTNWGNLTAAARWNWQISNKMFLNTTLTRSKYEFILGVRSDSREKIADPIITQAVTYHSGIRDWAAKIDLDYVPNPNHYIKTGFSATNHTYDPGATEVKFNIDGQPFNQTIGSAKTKANEFALYVEDDISYGALKANIGLHASGFAVGGTFYQSLQPRIGLNYLLSNSLAIKGSFCTMRQYINLLSNESLGLPSDLWVPSTEKIKPQDAWQAAIGLAKTMWTDYEFSLEGYYKEMKNMLAYKPGSSYLGSSKSWEEKVTQGNGEAYGMEFLVQKKKGRLNGWIGYTLSWNWRKFDILNSGKKFPFRYDRRHDLEIVANYQINKKWSIAGTWVYSTGVAFSLENVVYNTSQETDWINWNNGEPRYPYLTQVSQPSERNSQRMQPYHRFDINIEHTKKKKRYERTWSFGAYNAYNRRNPFLIYPDYDPKSNREVYKQLSLFPIIPNVSWSFKF